MQIPSALTCALGTSYLGYPESTVGDFTVAEKHKYWVNYSEPFSEFISLTIYVSMLLYCITTGGYMSHNTVSACVCYQSWQRDQHYWRRCPLFRAPAGCSSGRSSAPLWTWIVRIHVTLHVYNQTFVVDYKRPSPNNRFTDKKQVGGINTLY